MFGDRLCTMKPNSHGLRSCHFFHPPSALCYWLTDPLTRGVSTLPAKAGRIALRLQEGFSRTRGRSHKIKNNQLAPALTDSRRNPPTLRRPRSVLSPPNTVVPIDAAPSSIRVTHRSPAAIHANYYPPGTEPAWTIIVATQSRM